MVFVRDFLRWDVSDEAVSLVASVADIGNTGSISLDEFMAMERIMRMPDAHFRLAFRMCDKKGKGNITVEDFMTVMRATQVFIFAVRFLCVLFIIVCCIIKQLTHAHTVNNFCIFMQIYLEFL